jgi:hypothetical protein
MGRSWMVRLITVALAAYQTGKILDVMTRGRDVACNLVSSWMQQGHIYCTRTHTYTRSSHLTYHVLGAQGTEGE